MTDLNLLSRKSLSIKGSICVPGDKSMSHRSLILGALAKGTTLIKGFLDAEDCMATLGALQSMGVFIEGPDEYQVVVHGMGKYGLKKPAKAIDCGNSGTSMRLLAGLLAAQDFDSLLIGDESLSQRPMERISQPLMQMGARITTVKGKAPISIRGGQRLKGIHYLMPQASAQVKSCILLAGLYAQGETLITEADLSRNHTELMLQHFSYPIHRFENTLVINSKHECLGTEVVIPGDISSAAFFIVAATIIPGSDLIICNVGINETRTGIIHILLEMGADIILLNQRQQGMEWVADLHIKYAPLHGIPIPIKTVPFAIDEFPIIFIAAACAQGQTTLHGAHELRFKESNRIVGMVNGLKTLGINAQALDDGVIIEGGGLEGGVVDSLGDHRIAMSFAIAGAVAKNTIRIKNCAPIATSFPSFVETSKELQLQIEEVTDVR